MLMNGWTLAEQILPIACVLASIAVGTSSLGRVPPRTSDRDRAQATSSPISIDSFDPLDAGPAGPMHVEAKRLAFGRTLERCPRDAALGPQGLPRVEPE